MNNTLRDAINMLSARVEGLADDIAHDLPPTWAMGHLKTLVNEVRAAAGLPVWIWQDGRECEPEPVAVTFKQAAE